MILLSDMNFMLGTSLFHVSLCQCIGILFVVGNSRVGILAWGL